MSAVRPGPAVVDDLPASRRRRVVFVANSLAVGGAERQLVHAATGLASRGHDVRVATLLDWVGLQDVLRDAGIPITQLRARRPLRAATALVDGTRYLRAVAPDVVVTFDFQANLLGRLAGRAAGVPAVISSIRSERFGGPAREWWIRATDRLAAVTTTNSEAVAADLVGRRLVAADRIAVVPNAIDVAPLCRPAATRTRLRRALGVGPQEFLWVAVGHLVPRKDHGTLLDAFALTTHRRDARVVVAGGGDVEAFAREAAARGIGDRVSALGWRDDVGDLLAAADGLVSSSVWEGLPNAVLEAQAIGLPVVATRAGGTAELVADGVTGHLAPVQDAPALAAAMDRLQGTSQEERGRMGAEAATRSAERFSPTTVTDGWVAVVDRALAARSRA